MARTARTWLIALISCGSPTDRLAANNHRMPEAAHLSPLFSTKNRYEQPNCGTQGEIVHREQPDRAPIQRPGIAALVYNYAAISPAIMSRARETVDRLYREAGVEIEWLDPFLDFKYRVGPASNPLHKFTVQILIRSIRAPRAPSTPQSVMGEALPATENSGTLFVFSDQVVRVARQYNQPLADVLGLAIAHEMGHLLLPVHGHSRSGIMRADWSGDDLRHGVDGSLAFTSDQAVMIRTKVEGCCSNAAK